MDLFLIRHGISAPRSAELADADRPLTDDGLAQCRKIRRGLERLGLRFDRLLHSPWLRAVQTADVLADLLAGECQVTTLLAAPPGEALLAELNVGNAVAVVGHQPWLTDLAGMLLVGEHQRPAIKLGKGGLLWLRGEPRAHGATLVAALPSMVLTKIRRR